MFFWAIFKQNGTALTNWAEYYTDRSVPASVEKPLEDIYMVDGKDFKDKEVSVYDDQYQTQKGEDGKTLKTQGKDIYFRNIKPEQKAQLEQNPSQKVFYTIQNYSSPLIHFG